MAELTAGQKKALAMASARLRLGNSGKSGEDTEAIKAAQAAKYPAPRQMRPGDKAPKGYGVDSPPGFNFLDNALGGLAGMTAPLNFTETPHRSHPSMQTVQSWVCLTSLR